MAYNVIVSPRAHKEIENAIDYYALYEDDKNTIRILSCFHNKRNPNKKPRD